MRVDSGGVLGQHSNSSLGPVSTFRDAGVILFTFLLSCPSPTPPSFLLILSSVLNLWDLGQVGLPFTGLPVAFGDFRKVFERPLCLLAQLSRNKGEPGGALDITQKA